jgi:hypothetical protein
MSCISIDTSTSILTLNINVISLNVKSSIKNKKIKKIPTPETKLIFFVILIFQICNVREITVNLDVDMDININVGCWH